MKYDKLFEKRLGSNQSLMYKLKNKFMKMGDPKFNDIVSTCASIPKEKFNLKNLFSAAVKEDPMLVALIAKEFVINKIKSLRK